MIYMGAEEKGNEKFSNLTNLIKDLIDIHEENKHLKEAEIRYKAMVESLQEKMQSYKLVMENLPHQIFTKDREFRYSGFNERYARNLKITPGEILGKQDMDIFPPEIAEKYHLEDRRIIEQGEVVEREEKCICDGKEMITQTIKVPIKAESEEIKGILGVTWEVIHSKEKAEELNGKICELHQLLEVQTNGLDAIYRELQEQKARSKQLEEKIQDLEESYRLLFENIGTPVVLIDGDNLICTANGEFEKFSGYSKEELNGQKKWNEFLANDGQERMNELLLSSGTNSIPPGSYECAFVDKHNNRKIVSMKITPHQDSKKLLISLSDITKSKLAQEALDKSLIDFREVINKMETAANQLNGP